MTLPMDDQGLPLPGRELDRWIAEHVFGRDPLNARHGLHEDGDIEYYWGYPEGHHIAPAYSTSAAFFQVMEAMRGGWEFTEYKGEGYTGLQVTRHDDCYDYMTCHCEMIEIELPDYPDREHAYAHAVCCCAYLARKGENDA